MRSNFIIETRHDLHSTFNVYQEILIRRLDSSKNILLHRFYQQLDILIIAVLFTVIYTDLGFTLSVLKLLHIPEKFIKKSQSTAFAVFGIDHPDLK